MHSAQDHTALVLGKTGKALRKKILWHTARDLEHNTILALQ